MKGALLVNLGSPESTDVKDVKHYLNEFLMDKRVIDVPYLIRAFIVKGIILRTRPEKSAEAYKKIWTNEGSPLIVFSKKLRDKVQNHTEIPVELAMRYGKPSIRNAIQNLATKGVSEIVLIPLYPQYAMATTETITSMVTKIIEKDFQDIKLRIIPPFYQQKNYIKVLANSIKHHIEKAKPDHLLFSYHGVPERHIRKSDITKKHCKIDGSCCNTPSPSHEFCYRHQCYETTNLIAKELHLKEGFYSTSFQSRLGNSPWLQPYTSASIDSFPKNGIKNLAVVTPAFVSDCLETIEEIGMESKKSFQNLGGKIFTTIPCLNADEEWAKTIADWIHA